MRVAATTVKEYLAALAPDRRAALSAVRQVILDNLPEGYVEGLMYGMLGYAIPLARFPDTYNGYPLAVASLGAQKNHLVVHLMCLYGDTSMRQWFEDEYRKSGKKLDAGKACVRFKTLDDLPLPLIGQAIAKVPVEKLIDWHNKAQAQRPHKRPITKKPSKTVKKARH